MPPQAQGLQRLLVTLMQSLPALANVGGVMLLFFFIYAIIGMNLFGSIKHGDFLNRQANFQNFPNAMLVLMRWVRSYGTPRPMASRADGYLGVCPDLSIR